MRRAYDAYKSFRAYAARKKDQSGNRRHVPESKIKAESRAGRRFLQKMRKNIIIQLYYLSFQSAENPSEAFEIVSRAENNVIIFGVEGDEPVSAEFFEIAFAVEHKDAQLAYIDFLCI